MSDTLTIQKNMRTEKMFLFHVWINLFVLIGDSLLFESDPDSLDEWAKLKSRHHSNPLVSSTQMDGNQKVPLPSQPRTLNPVVLGVALPLQLQRRLHGDRFVHLDLP